MDIDQSRSASSWIDVGSPLRRVREHPPESQGCQPFIVYISGWQAHEARAMVQHNQPSESSLGSMSPSAFHPEWLSMRAAAQHLGKSYTWLSRKWQSLGLRPRALGRDYRFSRKELDAVITRQRAVPRDKRKKVVRVIHA